MYKNLLSKLPIKTNAFCRKTFLHDFNGVPRNVTNKIVSDSNHNFNSKFNVSFIRLITKSTKPSKIEKENTANLIKKDIEAKWKRLSLKPGFSG